MVFAKCWKFPVRSSDMFYLYYKMYVVITCRISEFQLPEVSVGNIYLGPTTESRGPGGQNV